MSGSILALARETVRELAASRGYHLIVPGDPFYAEGREAIVRVVSVMPGSLRLGADETRLREEVSFTLPPLPAAGLLKLVPVVGPYLSNIVDVVGADRPTMTLAPSVWGTASQLDDRVVAARLIGTGAHEVGHGDHVAHALRVGGDIGLSMWCLAYGINSAFRTWTEACEKTANVQARVILGGEPVADVVASELEALRAYGADEKTLDVARDVLASCAASLEAGQLHGEHTPLHHLLAALSRRDVSCGSWDGVIGA